MTDIPIEIAALFMVAITVFILIAWDMWNFFRGRGSVFDPPIVRILRRMHKMDKDRLP